MKKKNRTDNDWNKLITWKQSRFRVKTGNFKQTKKTLYKSFFYWIFLRIDVLQKIERAIKFYLYCVKKVCSFSVAYCIVKIPTPFLWNPKLTKLNPTRGSLTENFGQGAQFFMSVNLEKIKRLRFANMLFFVMLVMSGT